MGERLNTVIKAESHLMNFVSVIKETYEGEVAHSPPFTQNQTKMEERKILANWIMAPDGTMIPSFHRHDYREHTTVDNYITIPEEQRVSGQPINRVGDTRHSMVDGGTDYLRRGGKFTEMTVYDDDPFEVIRRFVCRGGRGEDGTEPLTWVPLFRMDDEWLKAVIKYNQERGIEGHTKWYAMELDYRMNGLKHRRNES